MDGKSRHSWNFILEECADSVNKRWIFAQVTTSGPFSVQAHEVCRQPGGRHGTGNSAA